MVFLGGFLVYWDYIGIMEKKMETTIVLGLYRDDRVYIGVI